MFAVYAVLVLGVFSTAAAQSLYKYQGGDGEWIYADRPPDGGIAAEVRPLEVGDPESVVTVDHRGRGRAVELVASNRFYAPVELRLVFDEIAGLEYPDPDTDLRWVLQPQSDTTLISLGMTADGAAPRLAYRYDYLVGDPEAVHRPDRPYRVPVALSSNYPITQAYPDAITHVTPDSHHAIDIAMPIGTDIFASRGGVVFDVKSKNFRSGLDPDRYLAAANLIRILHDDGTYALYAHLNWDSIRVRPGERVARGQFIAESGNTGFSSGPHLHFAVLKNTGMQVESLPVEFAGSSRRSVAPATGSVLTAH